MNEQEREQESEVEATTEAEVEAATEPTVEEPTEAAEPTETEDVSGADADAPTEGFVSGSDRPTSREEQLRKGREQTADSQ